jgi:hypothetical protein
MFIEIKKENERFKLTKKDEAITKPCFQRG